MEIIRVSAKNFKEITEKTIQAVKDGQVIICPTDTVYIPVADATNKKAVRKVFLIKKRSLKNPIPIFVKNIEMAKKLAHINKEQEKFLKKVWFTSTNFCENPGKEKKLVKIAPKIWVGKGKVTVIFKRKKSKIKLYGVDKKTIALRIPNFKLVNFLLKELNRPLVGTSANITGRPASGNLKEVLNQFKDQKYQPDLAVDSGILSGKPSKVIDLTVSPPKILRL